MRTGLFVLGCILVAMSPAVGVIPGPGGLIVFAAGRGADAQDVALGKAAVRHMSSRRWPKVGIALTAGCAGPARAAAERSRTANLRPR